MSLHKLAAGNGYTYLTRQVAALDATSRGYDGLGDYYSQKGESPGQWMGRGYSDLPGIVADPRVTEAQMVALFGEGRHPDAAAIETEMLAQGRTEDILKATQLGKRYPLYEGDNEFHKRLAVRFQQHNEAYGFPADWPVPEAERAVIRTEVARAMFAEKFDRPPADPRELSGFVARLSRQSTTAVAGYDLTFTPVKSVSTLWAVAPQETAQAIEAAHQSAVADTLAWLEDNATYTRLGAQGVRQVEVKGLIAAAFTHRDSRAGDPNLHTHVAVSNKVQTPDGKWLAVDGRPLHKMTVAASERYNTRLEAHLRDSLGVEFAERPGREAGKRSVREVVGVPQELAEAWSSRRADIEVRRAELSAKFQAEHGRTPSVVESIKLAQQATLETRQAKHEPRSLAEQRTAWRTQAVGVLGGEDALTAMMTGALSPATRPAAPLTDAMWVNSSAAAAVETIASSRATWSASHLRAEAERTVRAANVPLQALEVTVDALVAASLDPQVALPLGAPDPVVDPQPLRRTDGSSVYSTAGAQLYTSPAIVAAEEQLVATARRRDGRVVDHSAVEMALLESTANGVELNPGQVALVRELATSGARLQLALAPAGTGKTTAMRVLTQAWTAPPTVDAEGQIVAGVAGEVIGLAPSAAAAAVLRAEIGVHTDTLAMFVTALDSATPPAWLADIGPQTLVVIDEAGMAGTTDLGAAVDFITARGGSVRLIGDDQQLAAIGAGGVLRDIAEEVGAVTLSQVMRFSDPAEGAASLAMRVGETSSIGFYIDNDRVSVGDETTVADDAYQGWAADREAGRDSIMLAPTRELVSQLNNRARDDRLAQDNAPVGAQVALGEDSAVSAGDTIITRNNDRRLRITATDWVKNGDRWTVQAVTDDGGLTVTHLATGRTLTLPADYVRDHVQLGYATTVHAAQGVTADTSHTVATGAESRQLLYVAMTRGRDGNHLYLSTAGDGDPHAVITPDAILPPTAVDILTRVLDRDGSPVSATSTTRALVAPTVRLRDAARRYDDALAFAAEAHLGPEKMAEIDAVAEALLPGLIGAEAYPTLRAHLALVTLNGGSPYAELNRAITYRELDSALDVAAVLDWRLDPTGQHSGKAGPLPWLPAVPRELVEDPEWGTYLTARDELVRATAQEVREATRSWTPQSAPGWASALVAQAADPDQAQAAVAGDLTADLAVWRAVADTAEADRRVTGRPALRVADIAAQRQLNKRATAVLGSPNAATQRWAALAEQVEPRILDDAFWPQLADSLAIAARAGINVPEVVAAAVADKPLPDELPAAALWWRLSRHLGPAAVTANAVSATATLRPEWTPELVDVLGQRLARNALADPAWPSLVAAVSDATGHGWAPAQVLSTAFDLLTDGQDGAPVAGHEIATALAWRIAMLTEASAPAYTSTGGTGGTGGTDQEVPLPADPADLLDPTDFLDHTDLYPTDGSEGVEGLDEAVASLTAEDQQWLAANDWTPGPEDDSADPVAMMAPSPTPSPAPVPAPTAQGGPAPTPDAQEWLHQVSPGRIVDLNDKALAFFTARYPDSWAAPYLQERLGTDLSDDERFHPGYAPAGWTNLTDHLRAAGATDEELLAAGLSTQASTGRLIDRFRDRLVLPIYHGEAVHGFVGRRNPATDDAGPKYLNTADTGLFTKGDQLYGAAEAAAQLAAGATPVLVEGPLDAIAVTLAGGTDYVGVAPLGTAFTDTQADSLAGITGPVRAQPVLATDGDTAGRKAADRAYWMLTQRGYNPGHSPMPDGLDPADLARLHGPEALRGALSDQVPLADSLVEARVARYADRLDTPEGKVLAVRAAAQVIAALPPQHWAQHIEQLITLVDPAPGVVHLEVFEAGQAWTDDPAGATRRHLAERHRPTNPITTPTPNAEEGDRPTPAAAAAPSTPATSATLLGPDWAQLAASAHPPLLQDSEWPQLEAALVRAEAAGYPASAALPRLIAAAPLPDEHPARAVQYRLIAETPAAMTPIDWRLEVTAGRAVAEEAEQRMARADPPAAAGDPDAVTDPELLAGRADTRRAELSTRNAVTHDEERRPDVDVDGPTATQGQSQPQELPPSKPRPTHGPRR